MATLNMSLHLEDGELLRAKHGGKNGTYWLTLCFGRDEVSTFFNSEEEARIYWLAIQSAHLKVEEIRKKEQAAIDELNRQRDEAA